MALAQQVPNLGLARFSVQDKSILITGATGSLGRVAARALADAGARLTLAGGNSAGLAELVNGAGIDDAAVVTCRPDSLADAQQMVEAALADMAVWTECWWPRAATMWRPLPRWPSRTSTL